MTINSDALSEYDRDEAEELMQAIEDCGWKITDMDLYKDVGQKRLSLGLVK